MGIEEIKNKVRPILEKNGVKRAAIFGSFARGEEKKQSDVDIWVELSDEKTLFDLMDLQTELSRKIKRKVDLGEYCAIRPRIKANILKEQVFIYGEA